MCAYVCLLHFSMGFRVSWGHLILTLLTFSSFLQCQVERWLRQGWEIEVCAWSVLRGLSNLLLLKLSMIWPIVRNGKKASTPSIWCWLWGEVASAITVPISASMLFKKTFLPRPRNSYLVNVNTPGGNTQRGLGSLTVDSSSKLAVYGARKMSNLTEVNKLMVGWFMGSLEAILWPKPVWKPQRTLLWERRRKRLFGEGEWRMFWSQYLS